MRADAKIKVFTFFSWRDLAPRTSTSTLRPYVFVDAERVRRALALQSLFDVLAVPPGQATAREDVRRTLPLQSWM